MKMIDGEALRTALKERLRPHQEEADEKRRRLNPSKSWSEFLNPAGSAFLDVLLELDYSLCARPSPVRLLADKLSREAEDECMRPKRTAYNVMQSIVDRLDALADELGEPPLEEPGE